MNRLLILVCVFLFFSLRINTLNAQDICKDGVYEMKKGFAVSSSTTPDHFMKKGILLNLSEYQCAPIYFIPNNLVYTVNQQSDLIYFEEYYDSTHIVLKTQGYYRLTYIDSETGYCWLKDLVWNYYDNKGVLQKKEFYNRDKIVESPAMPQPTLTNSTFKKKE
jgi:hypothetical protein